MKALILVTLLKYSTNTVPNKRKAASAFLLTLILSISVRPLFINAKAMKVSIWGNTPTIIIGNPSRKDSMLKLTANKTNPIPHFLNEVFLFCVMAPNIIKKDTIIE